MSSSTSEAEVLPGAAKTPSEGREAGLKSAGVAVVNVQVHESAYVMPLRVPVTVIVLEPGLRLTLLHFATLMLLGVVLPIVTPLTARVTDEQLE